jgi:hypothetical protein
MGSMTEITELRTIHDRRRFLLHLICFAACIEGLFFFAAFAYVYTGPLFARRSQSPGGYVRWLRRVGIDKHLLDPTSSGTTGIDAQGHTSPSWRVGQPHLEGVSSDPLQRTAPAHSRQ